MESVIFFMRRFAYSMLTFPVIFYLCLFKETLILSIASSQELWCEQDEIF